MSRAEAQAAALVGIFMTAIRRRRLILECLRATLLIMIALLAESGDHLFRVEQLLYDLRARFCQRHVPPPTARLVHLDIDDTALSNIGRWPWERDKLAEILDEIRLAKPTILAMDLLFAEASSITYDRDGREINPDVILASSLRRLAARWFPHRSRLRRRLW